MLHSISFPQVISIIWLFSFLSASPWALFTKVLQQYCVFSRVFPWYLEQNKLLLCTIQSFFDSFHQGASTISTGTFISFLNLHFFLPSPFRFFLVVVFVGLRFLSLSVPFLLLLRRDPNIAISKERTEVIKHGRRRRGIGEAEGFICYRYARS